MTNLINLTPHDISIADTEGETVLTIPSSGSIRLATNSTILQTVAVNGQQVEIRGTSFGEARLLNSDGDDVGPMPEAEEGTMYIVSGFVLGAFPDRADLVRPDTGPTAVRDESNRVKAVRALTR